MVKLIIHSPTRVIMRSTIDDNPSIAPDESTVEVEKYPEGMAEGGYWKLNPDDKTVTQATTKEILDSRIDEEAVALERRRRYRAMTQALKEACDDVMVSGTVKKYLVKLNDFLSY